MGGMDRDQRREEDKEGIEEINEGREVKRKIDGFEELQVKPIDILFS